MASSQMERGGPEGSRPMDHQQKGPSRLLVREGRWNQSGVDAMNAGQKLFQDYLKANAEAVKRFQEENEKLRKEYEAIIEKEKANA